MASNQKNVDQISASRPNNQVEDDEELQGDLPRPSPKIFYFIPIIPNQLIYRSFIQALFKYFLDSPSHICCFSQTKAQYA